MNKPKRKLGKMALSLALCVGLWAAPADALPEGPDVVHGSVTITGGGQSLNINQATQRAIINWNGFSISAGELVRFLQPSQAAAILNRVQGVDPSVINGILEGNGTVMLINPNGVLIGPGGAVNTGSFVGSTLNVSDADFLSGNMTVRQDQNRELGAIVNEGRIEVADGGFVVLTSPTIANEGVIVARAGQISLGTGTQGVINFDGGQLINFAMDLNQEGALLLSRSQTNDFLAQAVNNAGVEEAGTLSNNGTLEAGSILLQAQGNLNLPGETRTEDIVGTTAGDANLGSHLALDGHSIDITAGGDITFDALVAERLNGEGGFVDLDAGGSILANPEGLGIAGDSVTLIAASGDISTPVAANSVSATAPNGSVALQIAPGQIDGPVVIQPIEPIVAPDENINAPINQQVVEPDGATGTLVGQNGTVVSILAGSDVNVTSVNTLIIDQVSGRNVNLSSSTGSVVDGGDVEGADNRDVIASGNANLSAADFVGTLDQPLEVDIDGDLNVLAQREIEGTSGVVNGVVGGEFIQEEGTAGVVLLNYGNGGFGIQQALSGVFGAANTLVGDDDIGGSSVINLFYANLIQGTDEDAWLDILRGTVVWEDEEDEADDL